jgi:3-oxoacyl-[acyl-carrier protein] reductase
MLLQYKNAVIYGAGGAIGSAVARAFAREGAKLYLTGRSLAKIAAVAKKIAAEGGAAEAAEVDALNEQEITKHAEEVANKAGSIDISFNVISVPHVQGTPLIDLPLEDFVVPVKSFARTHFLTARTAARHMIQKGSGVILMMTTTPDRRGIPLVGAFGVTCAGVEALSHTLAAEVGPRGVRVVCLRSSGSPETPGVQTASEHHAKARGMSREEWLETYMNQTLLHRLTTLEELTNMATFMASDRASAVTGTAVNLTCGAIVD